MYCILCELCGKVQKKFFNRYLLTPPLQCFIGQKHDTAHCNFKEIKPNRHKLLLCLFWFMIKAFEKFSDVWY